MNVGININSDKYECRYRNNINIDIDINIEIEIEIGRDIQTEISRSNKYIDRDRSSLVTANIFRSFYWPRNDYCFLQRK